MQNIEFLEELTIENLGNLGFGNELLNTKKSKIHEGKNGKLESTKIKDFCFMKGTVKRIKTHTTDWAKIFARHLSNKEILSKLGVEKSL